jgi:hypothetical protein
MSVIEVFLELSASITESLRHEIVRRQQDGEEVISVSIEGPRSIANATFWERPHVAGLVDFNVIDTSGKQVFWHHLEGPTEALLRAGWDEMMAAIGALERG